MTVFRITLMKMSEPHDLWTDTSDFILAGLFHVIHSNDILTAMRKERL